MELEERSNICVIRKHTGQQLTLVRSATQRGSQLSSTKMAKKKTTNDSNDPIMLQKTGLHYDLLLLRRLRRKTHP